MARNRRPGRSKQRLRMLDSAQLAAQLPLLTPCLLLECTNASHHGPIPLGDSRNIGGNTRGRACTRCTTARCTTSAINVNVDRLCCLQSTLNTASSSAGTFCTQAGWNAKHTWSVDAPAPADALGRTADKSHMPIQLGKALPAVIRHVPAELPQ